MKKAEKKVREYLERATEIFSFGVKSSWFDIMPGEHKIVIEIAKMIQREEKHD